MFWFEVIPALLMLAFWLSIYSLLKKLKVQECDINALIFVAEALDKLDSLTGKRTSSATTDEESHSENY